MKFGNLLIAGLVTGSIYAVFAVCVSVWYRVSNILNLAVGDFAMLGALGVDDLLRVRNWPLPAAIATTLAVVAAFGDLYDRVVLTLAQDGRRCWPRCSASSSRRSPATPIYPARRSR
jgi:branched-chain amino acid transport system permease protein